MKWHMQICNESMKDNIKNGIILGWSNVARVSNIVSHRRLKWLGHLARMPDGFVCTGTADRRHHLLHSGLWLWVRRRSLSGQHHSDKWAGCVGSPYQG